ncbi:alcohol oxidase [Schizopora paradoxa]|uniref:Alcohol oxidase n=1 Tax=Schizopora paradoxa TaxID=27342 RepID=A0A0H2RVF3_9AGAM|nr:alcohol oxidase [Schizopora paradoxa]
MIVNVKGVSSKTFDYVIIGGGTSGLALAARLSEDPATTVLVLEAGEANLQDPKILTPGVYGRTLLDPKYDWAYFTTEQPSCANRKLFWPRGKGLGGSSALNFLMWTKPSRFDVDAFERLGNPGWNWSSFDKYSKRSEGFASESKNTDKELLAHDDNSHGQSGPIITSYPGLISGVEKPTHEALNKVGINMIKTLMGGYADGHGAGVIPGTVDPKTYTRSYAATGYYEPNANRPNLTVVVSAHVSEIVTVANADGTLTATEVKFLCEDASHSVKVGKETIVSAGAINSPQVLELSGIGERSVLEKAGIDVKLELPGVGNNMQDHYYLGLTYEIKESFHENIHTFDGMFNPEVAEQQMTLYTEKKGLCTMYILGLMFAPFDAVSPDADELNKTHLSAIEAGLKSGKYPPGLQKQYEIQFERLQKKLPSIELCIFPGMSTPGLVPEPGKKYVSLMPVTNHPFARGSVHITSKDPLAPPAIDPATFKEDHDLAVMVEAVKFARKVAQQEPLASMITGNDILPGPDVQSDEDIAEKFVKQVVSTSFHTSSSLSMLPREDGGVVDNKLKVYGTTNIRVADTSIIPLHISAHTQAIAYAIGEQAADIIKGLA